MTPELVPARELIAGLFSSPSADSLPPVRHLQLELDPALRIEDELAFTLAVSRLLAFVEATRAPETHVFFALGPSVAKIRDTLAGELSVRWQIRGAEMPADAGAKVVPIRPGAVEADALAGSAAAAEFTGCFARAGWTSLSIHRASQDQELWVRASRP